MGAAAHGEVDERGKEVCVCVRGVGVGALCIILNHP